MGILKYALMFLLCSNLLIGCTYKQAKPNNTKQNNPKNEYDERVDNILKVTALGNYLSSDTCMTVYLLQTTTCSVCSKTGLENIKHIEKDKGRRVIFLLAGHKEDIEGFLKTEFDLQKVVVIYDDTKEMPGLGLNFFKDMGIQICNRKVIKWDFVDG